MLAWLGMMAAGYLSTLVCPAPTGGAFSDLLSSFGCMYLSLAVMFGSITAAGFLVGLLLTARIGVAVLLAAGPLWVVMAWPILGSFDPAMLDDVPQGIAFGLVLGLLMVPGLALGRGAVRGVAAYRRRRAPCA